MPNCLHRDRVLLDGSFPLPLDLPFTPAQAAAEGVSREQLRRLVEHGLVRRVVRGVYAAAQAPGDLTFRARALHLVVSSDYVVTDRTAAWLHGVDVLPRTAREVAVPVELHGTRHNRSRRSGVASGERTLAAHDVMEVHGLAVTTPLRTACDLGRRLWRFDALGALDGFLRLGVPVESLLLEVERFKGHRGVVQLRTLVPLADARAESMAESALRLHWLDAGLPRPELQWWVDDGGVPTYRLDLALPEAMFAAEYNGADFHTSPDDAAYDARRMDWLVGARRWTVEVFVRQDVYPLRADPGPRLRSGLARARSALGVSTSYPMV